MKLSERIEEYRVALSLFPKCATCGRDLSDEPVLSLRLARLRPYRFTCREDCDAA